MSHQPVTEQPSVGVLGLGNLGAGIASRLLDAGFEVAGADTSANRTAEMAEQGVRIGTADVIGSDVVCVVTPDERGLIALLDEHEGEIARKPPTAIVLCSTVRPDAAISLGTRLAEIGTHLVEAPVSGGATAARNGHLSMMVSGPAAGVRAVESVLNALTRRRFTFDRAGAASAVKLGNQVALYAALAGVLEAVALAKSFGVDEDALVEVLRDSTGDSWAARNLEFFTDLVREYDRSSVPGKDRPWRKDLDEFAGIARDRRAPHRFAAELAARFGDDLELFVHNHGGAK